MGTGLGLGWAALLLTLISLFYSIVVAFRILVVDSLAYSSTPHRNTPIRELAKMKAWNEGPLRGKGGIGVVIASLITSEDSLGANIGMRIMDRLSRRYFVYDRDKWRDERESEFQ